MSFTEGVWLWTTPIYLENQNLYLYFLEFEGYDEFEKSKIFEEKLMILAMTISSAVLISNNKDYEDESDKIFALIHYFDQNVRVNNNIQWSQSGFPMPAFFWILKENDNFLRKSNFNLDKYKFLLNEEKNELVRSLRNDANIIWFDETHSSINILRQKLFSRALKKEILGVVMNNNVILTVINQIVGHLNHNNILDFYNM